MAKVDTWKKYVIEGKCELFEEWNAYTGVTKEDFLKGLDWLFEDTEPDKPRRELVCTQDGKLHHYRRVYYEDGSFNAFITFEGKPGKSKTAEAGQQNLGLLERTGKRFLPLCTGFTTK